MRVLYLGTSDDRGPAIEGTAATPEIVETMLSTSLATSVELIVKEAWPNENLPAVLERWVAEVDPDLIVICVNGYWFSYTSVPQKLRRVFVRAGSGVANTGLRLADVPWFAHNVLFRTARRLVTAAVGGDTFFSGREVVERIEECVKTSIRREGTIVAVRGAEGQSPYAETARSRDGKELRRTAVNNALAEMCRKHHIKFVARQEPVWRSHAGELEFTGDGIHKGASTLRMRAERIVLVIEEAIAATESDATIDAPNPVG